MGAFPHKVFYACSVKNTTFLNLKVKHYCFVSGITRYKNKAQMRKHVFQDNWSPSEVNNLYAFAPTNNAWLTIAKHLRRKNKL